MMAARACPVSQAGRDVQPVIGSDVNILAIVRRHDNKERKVLRRFQWMHADANGLDELSGAVIGCRFTVLDTLGARSLEKIYEDARVHELRKKGPAVSQQRDVRGHAAGRVENHESAGRGASRSMRQRRAWR